MRDWVNSFVPVPIVCTALLALVCGCSDDDPSSAIHLEVEGFLPVVPVPVDTALIVEFSHDFDLASAESRCRLEVFDTSETVSCSLGFVAGTNDRLELTPDELLEYSTLYSLTILVGVESADVEPLVNPGQWIFETEADPSSGPELHFSPFDVSRHGYDLHAVWESPNGAIHAGADGVALITGEFSEFRWLLSTGTGQRINGVWCSETGTTWMAYGDGAGTGGGVIRFANRSRFLMAATTHAVSGVFGVAEDHVYATHGNQVLEFTASGQEVHTGPEAVLLDIWAFRGPTEDILWVAGSEGLYRGVRTGSGITWERVIDTTYPLVAVSGIAADSVVAVGATNVHRLAPDHRTWVMPLYQWIDVSWHEDAPGPIVVGISPTGGGAAVVFHGDSPVTTDVTPEPLYAVHADYPGTSPDAAVHGYAVGAAGTWVRVNPELDDWTIDPIPKRHPDGTLAKWTDVSANAEAVRNPLFGLHANEILLFGSSNEWAPRDGPEDLTLTKIFCEAEDSLYAVGLEAGGIDRYVSHYDGSDWTSRWMSSMDVPNDIWGADPNDVFVVCDYGVAYRVTDSSLLMVVGPSGEHLRGVWGTAANSVYAVGEDGLIARFTIPPTEPAGVWTVMVSGTTNDLHAIHGTSANHIVAVGDSRTVLRFNGNDWVDLSPTTVPPIVDLTMVATRSENEVWVASPDGDLLRFNGSTWQVWSMPLPGIQLNATAYIDPLEPWFGGEDDLLLRFMALPSLFPLIEED